MTPLPFQYACHCRLLLGLFLVSIPFSLDASIGAFGNAGVNLMIGLALLGIDAIATELENPFGDDANDLDLLEPSHMFETEALTLLDLSSNGGSPPFVWTRLHPCIAALSCKPMTCHASVARYAWPRLTASECPLPWLGSDMAGGPSEALVPIEGPGGSSSGESGDDSGDSW
eukprot:NODE_5377_length_587_cov_244.302632.p2 GENE.NODE_5377_length_587_cov_244.302632~~NODE_5377_length_587_cov_244.302632.p2  ORF type:complete len:186 (-),score=40.64 NODE_5377_length_587_cov_244.302632:13-528(-)